MPLIKFDIALKLVSEIAFYVLFFICVCNLLRFDLIYKFFQTFYFFLFAQSLNNTATVFYDLKPFVLLFCHFKTDEVGTELMYDYDLLAFNDGYHLFVTT